MRRSTRWSGVALVLGGIVCSVAGQEAVTPARRTNHEQSVEECIRSFRETNNPRLLQGRASALESAVLVRQPTGVSPDQDDVMLALLKLLDACAKARDWTYEIAPSPFQYMSDPLRHADGKPIMPGTAPHEIEDPETRRLYVAAIAREELDKWKRAREIPLLRTQSRCVRVLRERMAKYPSTPETRAALEKMIREGITRRELQDEILKADWDNKEKYGRFAW